VLYSGHAARLPPNLGYLKDEKMPKIDVSSGELLDKFSILEIKLEMMSQSTQISNIKTEIDLIKAIALPLLETDSIRNSYGLLKQVNQRIWDSMERLFSIRESEVNQYASEARLATNLNIERANIKRTIDLELNSAIKEAKSYF
jgi:hypothetical protein